MSESIHFWRRTDVEGLERLELAIEPEGVRATSTVICLEAGGFRLDHRWHSTPTGARSSSRSNAGTRRVMASFVWSALGLAGEWTAERGRT